MAEELGRPMTEPCDSVTRHISLLAHLEKVCGRLYQLCAKRRSSIEPPQQEKDRPEFVGGDDIDPVITLNVGGTAMQTRRSTLTWSSVYFRNIFAGPFKAERGQLFVDCDPTIFIHVLHYFRHSKLRIDAPLADVHDVANLFSVDPLLEEIERLIEVQRLTGRWHCNHGSMHSDILIYEHEGCLWYYEDQDNEDLNYDEPPSYNQRLTREGDFHITKDPPEGWLGVRVAARGNTLMLNSAEVDGTWGAAYHYYKIPGAAIVNTPP